MILGGGIGVGLFVWDPWDLDEDKGSAGAVSDIFCQDIADWHEAEEAFLSRALQAEYREGARYADTYSLYMSAADVELPGATSQEEQDIIGVMKSTLQGERRWLDALRFRNIVTASTVDTSAVDRDEAIGKLEAAEFELTVQLREVNDFLQNGCGLMPLPVYEPGSD